MTDRGAGREPFRGRVGITAAESEPWWPERASAPDGAPNVVVMVLDDTGFSHLGCYGSDIETPAIDRLAAGGLRYNNFHTTALCSSTRACLLTGRNHHSVGMRFLSNADTGFSNCRGYISNKAATLAEMLRATGYNTYALGKWHLANMEDCTPAGPFHQWPLQRGFDRYYGFLGGATDQFSPELVVDNHPIDPPSEDGYHLSEDLVTQAASMLTAQRSAAPDRPFFLYLAFGATHSPHQAPQAYLDKYRGRYDKGWDVTRQEWFTRQLEMGIVPPGTELAPRNPGVLPWDELSRDQQRLYARMQEAFAAFLDYTDDQIGRLLDFLETIDVLDNTLLILFSDNGASQEGGRDGMLNELAFFNRLRPSVEEMVEHVDAIGGPNLYNNYPRGWAQAGNTPLRFYKQNTYEGGIRDPLIVHWPNRIRDRGGIRTHYHHVIDILPTVLECVGIEAPDEFNGMPQLPVEGVSLAYSFDASGEPSRRHVQYYEMLGHRAIWVEGWKAVTRHRPGVPFEEDEWALFNTDEDFSECHDLAKTHPEKLRELIERWWAEAGRYNVLPLDDRMIELFVLRRPSAGGERRQFRFLPGAPHIDRFAVPDIRNRSHCITASIERDTALQQGVLVASGARTGGYVLYILNNRLIYEYNYVGRVTRLESDRELPLGPCKLGMRFTKSAEHAGIAALTVNGQEAGATPVELLPWRQAMYGMDIGRDQGSTISPAYAAPFRFDGRLAWVDFRLEDDREDQKKATAIEARNALTDQ
ncbi:MAG: arylsulfatase [Candidatus Entotheonella gemina]|uniref:Arylsulfatase n=2 Tax=Candidatus Entotheonella TaxID=93171 RepID=W4M351_9BACT|nr:MAG: arylsulfatase [Candidatus Entotheonella gemina]